MSTGSWSMTAAMASRNRAPIPHGMTGRYLAARAARMRLAEPDDIAGLRVHSFARAKTARPETACWLPDLHPGGATPRGPAGDAGHADWSQRSADPGIGGRGQTGNRAMPQSLGARLHKAPTPRHRLATPISAKVARRSKSVVTAALATNQDRSAANSCGIFALNSKAA